MYSFGDSFFYGWERYFFQNLKKVQKRESVPFFCTVYFMDGTGLTPDKCTYQDLVLKNTLKLVEVLN